MTEQVSDKRSTPECCPFCKSIFITYVATWNSESIDEPDNTDELEEYQCAACSKSFWI